MMLKTKLSNFDSGSRQFYLSLFWAGLFAGVAYWDIQFIWLVVYFHFLFCACLGGKDFVYAMLYPFVMRSTKHFPITFFGINFGNQKMVPKVVSSCCVVFPFIFSFTTEIVLFIWYLLFISIVHTTQRFFYEKCRGRSRERIFRLIDKTGWCIFLRIMRIFMFVIIFYIFIFFIGWSGYDERRVEIRVAFSFYTFFLLLTGLLLIYFGFHKKK